MKENDIGNENTKLLKWAIIGGILNCFITLLFENIISLNYREVILSNPDIKIFRPGNNLDIYLYYFIIVGLFSVVSFFAFQYIRKKAPKYTRKQLTIVMIIIYLPLLFIASKFAPIAKVDYQEVITGKAPASSNVFVFVKPLDGNGNYYPQENQGDYVIPTKTNRWRITCHFGGSPGLEYEIIAYACDQPLINDSINSMDIYSMGLLDGIFGNAEKTIRLVKHKKE
jgi:hypothetical protein